MARESGVLQIAKARADKQPDRQSSARQFFRLGMSQLAVSRTSNKWVEQFRQRLDKWVAARAGELVVHGDEDGAERLVACLALGGAQGGARRAAPRLVKSTE